MPDSIVEGKNIAIATIVNFACCLIKSPKIQPIARVIASKAKFRKGREQFNLYIPISLALDYNITSGNATEYRHKDKIVEIIDEYKAKVNRLYMALRTATDKERDVIYDRIFYFSHKP